MNSHNKQINLSRFQMLLHHAAELSHAYDDLVFIDRLAIYLHLVNHECTEEFAIPNERSSFYISRSSLCDLRDAEELIQNRAKYKHEMSVRGFIFDVFAEREAILPVPYPDAIAFASDYLGIKVASLEDLLVLKLEKALSRELAITNGMDARDVLCILLLANEMSFDPVRSVRYMNAEHLSKLSEIVASPEYIAISNGNAEKARKIKATCELFFSQINLAYLQDMADVPSLNSIEGHAISPSSAGTRSAIIKK